MNWMDREGSRGKGIGKGTEPLLITQVNDARIGCQVCVGVVSRWVKSGVCGAVVSRWVKSGVCGAVVSGWGTSGVCGAVVSGWGTSGVCSVHNVDEK